MILLILGGIEEKNLELVAAVRKIDTCVVVEKRNNLFLKILRKFGCSNAVFYNLDILLKSIRNYDCIIVVKGLFIWPLTLKKLKRNLPGKPIINWSLDSLWLDHNNTPLLKKSVRYYDILLNTKLNYESNLLLMGFPRVYTTYQPFSMIYHYREYANFPENRKKYLAFVGFANDEREELIGGLADLDIEILIVGPNWKGRRVFRSDNVRLYAEELRLKHYADFLQNAYACLGLLRTENLDLHTSRTVEIPLAGSCLISPGNIEIDYLLTKNGYCEYETIEDIKNILTLLWSNLSLRNSIAKNGHESILKKTTSYSELIRKLQDAV